MTYETHTPREERHSRVDRIATSQWGCIKTTQLRACGVNRMTQTRWRHRGLLHPMHHGVYVYGPLSPAPEQRWMAALLAAGERAALSHTTAAAVHGLIAVRSVIEVKSPTQRRDDETLRVRRGTGQITTIRGLRVTTVAQTLLDLAAIRWPVERLVNDALGSSLVDLGDLKAFALDHRGRRGSKALLKAVGLPQTRSAWERRFLKWATSLEGLPQPITNDRIDALTVDVHWPSHDLVIELDTDQTHGTPWAKRRDARRDAYLRRRGKKVRRIRKETFEPAAVEHMLLSLLNLRSSRRV
jgi:very-short-patch-repair endonuclease